MASSVGFLKTPQKLLVLLVAAMIGGGIVYGAMQYQMQHSSKSSLAAAKDEITSIIEKVGNLMVLPSGEIPTLATVSDKTKLTGQPFFANAQNGDKVLIYTTAKKAILYRPSINKIIEIGPLTITSPTPSVSIAAGAKLVLYNGTASKSAEIAQGAVKNINNTLPNVTIVKQENAKNTDYIKNLIVDLSGNYKDTETTLSQLFHARVTTQLPSGETKPQDGDILLILGQK